MKKYFLTICAGAMLMIGGNSCSKMIDDVYQNPNAPVKVDVETLLPEIVSAMAANYGGHGPMNDARYVGAYIKNWHYYSSGSYFDQMGYVNNSADVAQSFWRSNYYDIGQNNQKMMLWAAEQKKWDYVGVGKAIEAWGWLTLTDYYGEVILNDAFNTELLTFRYDTQEDVYNKVKKLCREALENLNKTGDGVSQANLAKGDAYFYNGDVEKWKKFTYGVLARCYNHYSNKSTYNADSVIYFAEKAMMNAADNGMVRFAATSISATNNFYGPFRSNLTGASVTTPTAIRQSSYMAKLMNGENSAFSGVVDPRGWYLLRGNNNGTLKGVDPNVGQTVLAANDRPENFWGVSQVSATNTPPPNDANCRFIFKNAGPVPVLTSTEMKFIIAEAAYRKGDKAKALQAYVDGINEHFNMLTMYYNANIPAGKEITAANRAAYLTAVTPTAANLTLSKIMMQKYIAMFGHGVLETWMDMRRYHYTDLDPATSTQVYADFTLPTLFSDNKGEPIYRYYPRYNSEYMWNIKELERIGATVTTYHTKKMWITEP